MPPIPAKSPTAVSDSLLFRSMGDDDTTCWGRSSLGLKPLGCKGIGRSAPHPRPTRCVRASAQPSSRILVEVELSGWTGPCANGPVDAV